MCYFCVMKRIIFVLIFSLFSWQPLLANSNQEKLSFLVNSFDTFEQFLRGSIPTSILNHYIKDKEKLNFESELDKAVYLALWSDNNFAVSAVYYDLVNSLKDNRSRKGFIFSEQEVFKSFESCVSKNIYSMDCLLQRLLKPIVSESIDKFEILKLQKNIVVNDLIKLILKRSRTYFWLYNKEHVKEIGLNLVFHKIPEKTFFTKCLASLKVSIDKNSTIIGEHCYPIWSNLLKDKEILLDDFLAKELFMHLRFFSTPIKKMNITFSEMVLSQEINCGLWSRQACKERKYLELIDGWIALHEIESIERDVILTSILENFSK